MKIPNFKKILIWGTGIFLSFLLSFIMADLEIFGNAKYTYLIVAYVLFVVFCVVIQWLWSFIPKIHRTYHVWLNKTRRIEFQISSISGVPFDNDLFFITVSCPVKSKHIGFLNTGVEIHAVRKNYGQDHKRDVRIIPTPTGNVSFSPSSYELLLNPPTFKKLSWQSNGKCEIKLRKYYLEKIDLFIVNREKKLFSIYTPPDKTINVFMNGNFGVGEHEFRIEFSGRDATKRLFEDTILYKVEFDGNKIETISAVHVG